MARIIWSIILDQKIVLLFKSSDIPFLDFEDPFIIDQIHKLFEYITQINFDYKLSLIKNDKNIIVNAKDLIKGIVKDLEQQTDEGVIAAKFHNSIAQMIYRVSKRLSKINGVKKAVLSGGVFQNAMLLTGLIPVLEKKGFNVYTHQLVPTNDGGISLGQAVAAAAIAAK